MLLVQTYAVIEPPKVTIDLGPNLTVAAQDSVTIDLLTNVPQSEILLWIGRLTMVSPVNNVCPFRL
jgi:hypothetical protein